MYTASRDAGKSAKCRCGAGAIVPDAMQCLLELAFCYEVPQVPQISKTFLIFAALLAPGNIRPVQAALLLSQRLSLRHFKDTREVIALQVLMGASWAIFAKIPE